MKIPKNIWGNGRKKCACADTTRLPNMCVCVSSSANASLKSSRKSFPLMDGCNLIKYYSNQGF